MCSVCCASAVLDASSKGEAHEFKWPERKGVRVFVQADPEHKLFGDAEGRNRIRIRKQHEDWSDWFSVRDLASAISILSVDTRWPFVTPEVARWLEGGAQTEEIVVLIQGKKTSVAHKGTGPKLSISLNVAEDLDTPDKIKTTAKDFGITQKELKRLIKEALGEKQ